MLDPQALQAQYLAALRQLLRSACARQPLALVLEDIHWADPSSTELFVKLLPLTAEAPLLFCFVTRPDRDAPGWRLVTAAREATGAGLTELSLNPLSDSDSHRLVSNLLEIESLPEQTRTLILKKAEGNPFFVEEVIRMLIDRGAIYKEGESWRAGKEIGEIEIPDNLHGLLLARIDRLPEETKRTLRVASVIGRQFSVRVLEQVLGRA
jgi:predicted ATPase